LNAVQPQVKSLLFEARKLWLTWGKCFKTFFSVFYQWA
jgi:hypothetical protein